MNSVMDEPMPPLSRLERFGASLFITVLFLGGVWLLLKVAQAAYYLYAIGTCGAA